MFYSNGDIKSEHLKELKSILNNINDFMNPLVEDDFYEEPVIWNCVEI
jgi:hypothetical protein